MKNLKNLNYRMAAWAIPFIVILLISILQLISLPTTFILFFFVAFILAFKPVYEICQMDFELSIENLELNDLYEDLID